MCRQHSGCLSLESALEKRSYAAYYRGLFLVNFMQQCFWRECKDNKGLFSPYPFLFQHRVQIHNTFPSIVGHSNFHAPTANCLYQTSVHLIIFCSMQFFHGFLCLNVITSSKLEPLPQQKQCLTFILHFLQGFSHYWHITAH